MTDAIVPDAVYPAPYEPRTELERLAVEVALAFEDREFEVESSLRSAIERLYAEAKGRNLL